jgi:hypothetical protein
MGKTHAHRLIGSAKLQDVYRQLATASPPTKSKPAPSPNLKQRKHKETHGICSFFALISTTKKKSLIFLESFFIVGLGGICLMGLSNTNVNSKHSSF